MCFSENSPYKDKQKCTVIAIVSLIFYVMLSCLSIVTLKVKINYEQAYSHSLETTNIKTTNYFFGNMSQSISNALFGTSLAVGILGTIASTMLLIGLRYNKPGFLVVYLCYSAQACFVFLIGGLLICLKLRWDITICLFGLTALICAIAVIVNRTYDAMVHDAALQQQNDISDLTLLIEEDLYDDQTSAPAM